MGQFAGKVTWKTYRVSGLSAQASPATTNRATATKIIFFICILKLIKLSPAKEKLLDATSWLSGGIFPLFRVLADPPEAVRLESFIRAEALSRWVGHPVRGRALRKKSNRPIDSLSQIFDSEWDLQYFGVRYSRFGGPLGVLR